MKISLVSAAATARKLSALIRKHDSISIAVAWGGITEVAQTLLAHSEKFESVLLGVDFSATEAALVDCLVRSEEHTSELQSLMRISYAVFCLKKKTTDKQDLCSDILTVSTRQRQVRSLLALYTYN